MKYTDALRIRKNPAYIEMLTWYAESVSQFDAQPHDLETTDFALYLSRDHAMHTALEALDAVIDAHVSQQIVVALQEKGESRIPIQALSGLMTDEAFHQSLTNYRLAWNALGEADTQQTRTGRREPEKLQQLDHACEVAERSVVEAVQEFARRRGSCLPDLAAIQTVSKRTEAEGHNHV